jgi:hypothetical protein
MIQQLFCKAFHLCRLAILAVGLFSFVGCASTSTMRPYTAQITPAINKLKVGDTDQALSEVVGKKQTRLNSSDKQLYLLEAGRISFLGGNFNDSASFFERAIQEIEQRDDAAVIQLTSVGSQAAAMILNDNAIPYQAAGYERILAYFYQCLNFLMIGDLDAAGIESRNALGAQQRAQQRTEREVARAHARMAEESENSSKSGISMDSVLEGAKGVVGPKYAGIDEVAGKVRNSHENPLNYFLSAFVIEMQGDIGTALPIYRDALELSPQTSPYQAAVFRYADDADRRELTDRFGQQVVSSLEGNGMGPEIMIVFSDDYIVQKEEIKIPIPIRSGLTALSMPFYAQGGRDFTEIELYVNEQHIGSLSPVLNTQQYAYRDLMDRMPGILIRALIRATAKAVASDQASRQGGALVGLGMSLVNVLTENADLRGWYTLPLHYYLYRGFLEEGEQRVTLKRGGQPIAELPLRLSQDHVTIAYVSTASGRTVFHHSLVRKPANLARRPLVMSRSE